MSRAVAEARSLVAQALPRDGTVDSLLAALGALRNRPFKFVSAVLTGTTSGLWLPRDTYDVLIYPQDASPLRRTAILCHELAHILLGHSPALHASISSLTVSSLAPDISPHTTVGYLARTDYTTPEEVAAEKFGTELCVELAAQRHEHTWVSQGRITGLLR